VINLKTVYQIHTAAAVALPPLPPPLLPLLLPLLLLSLLSLPLPLSLPHGCCCCCCCSCRRCCCCCCSCSRCCRCRTATVAAAAVAAAVAVRGLVLTFKITPSFSWSMRGIGVSVVSKRRGVGNVPVIYPLTTRSTLAPPLIIVPLPVV
jgi:hypothetical protein